MTERSDSGPKPTDWYSVKRWAQGKLEDNREEIEDTTRDLIQTSVTRGRIDVLKELLELESETTEASL